MGRPQNVEPHRQRRADWSSFVGRNLRIDSIPGAERGSPTLATPIGGGIRLSGVSGRLLPQVLPCTVSARKPDSSQKNTSPPSAFACRAKAGNVSRPPPFHRHRIALIGSL